MSQESPPIVNRCGDKTVGEVGVGVEGWSRQLEDGALRMEYTGE